jgi:predicted secreted Zn-dependent protease
MLRPPLARLAAALALLPVALFPAQAEPAVKEIITYYDVSGTTAAELRTSLSSLRPTSKKDGHGYDGFTR